MKKKTIIKSSLCILFVIAIGFMFKLNSNAKPKYKITNQTSPSLTECSHSIKKKIILNPSANKDGIQKEYCEKCKYVKYTKYICKHEHEALRLNNRSYSVGVSKLRHLHVLILAPVILILTGIIQQKSWQRYNKLLVHNLSFLYLPKQIELWVRSNSFL